MSEYSGSSLVVSWLQTAATTVISGDQRSFTYTPSIDFIETTAGADTHKTRITSTKDGTWTLNALFQSGTTSGGTALSSILAEGNLGTLQWQPEGTASTKPKYVAPAYSQGAQFSYPYDGVVEMTVNFQQNGVRTESAN